MTTQATWEELTAHHYKINRTRRELEKMQEKLDQRKHAADASSERKANLSAQLGNLENKNRAPGGRVGSRMAGIP
jgi:polyhydroxyalkanoate synthesis regulator phasin